MNETYIKVSRKGPYLVFGLPEIVEQKLVRDKLGVPKGYEEGESYSVANTPVALCRCGHSNNAPFCDHTHNKVHFNGVENAVFGRIVEGADAMPGTNFVVLDNRKFCANSHMCETYYEITESKHNKIRSAQEINTLKRACSCPSGSLMAVHSQGNTPIERTLKPSISPLEDPVNGISGPLWVQGGIRIESEKGASYEIRNRQTLCRCGYSRNKPFCSGDHEKIKFRSRKKNMMQRRILKIRSHQ